MKSAHPRKILSELSPILFVMAFSLPAYSAENTADQWKFQLAPYAWLTGQSGQVGTFPGLPAADINIDFWDDILGNINGAIMLVGEARKGDFGMFTDIVYTDIEIDDQSLGPFFTTLTSKTKSWVITAAGFYRLYEDQRRFLDLYGGIRYWSVDSELTIGTDLLPLAGISNKENWVDPIVGLKGKTAFGDSQFFVSGFFTVGGFGAGSDMMWDLNLNLGYDWTKTFSSTIGYRYMDVDYDNDGYLYDVSQDGPTIGLSWRF